MGDSIITEDTNKVGISTLTPVATLQVNSAQPPPSVGNGTEAKPLLQTSGGKGGNSTSPGAKSGRGADIFLLAGNGGDTQGGISGHGGNVLIQPGSPGDVPLLGGGTPGQFGRMLLVPFGGNIGIGTFSTESKLNIDGTVEILGGGNGVKFPDGTLQTTAAATGVIHDGTLGGDGSTSSPLGLTVPLSLSGSNAGAILSVSNGGTGPAIAAAGAIDTTTQYNIGGSRVLSVAGTGNLFAGVGAGPNNFGTGNTFVGSTAGQANTGGFLNSFLGHRAGQNNINGLANSFFGNSAGLNTTNGFENSFFGTSAGLGNTIGNHNTFVGVTAGYSNMTGNDNTFVGFDAGRLTTSSWNSFFGSSAGRSNTTGSENSFFGRNAGLSNSTGNRNTFVGTTAGSSNTSGNDNTFAGNQAGGSNTSGSYNTFVGGQAGAFNTTGFWNSFFGFYAGRFNTTGYANSFFGLGSGYNNTAGTFNSFFGRDAGVANTTGVRNSFFGDYAGSSNTTGLGNTFIGAGSNGTANLRNATAIGYEAKVEQDNSLVLGSIDGVNDATATVNVGIGTTAPTSRLEVRGGEIKSSGPDGGRFTALNPNNDDAVVYLDWFNDGTKHWPRIRYGGSGEGSQNGFLIQGTSNITKLAVLHNGNIGIGTPTPQQRLHVVGNAIITGNLSKGSGSFKIDHPLDPANKYLAHSFVESPDMMNIYNGNVTTDRSGRAVVRLPDYFASLNRDFRYQLTVIGEFAQAIVLRKIKDNRFVICTNRPRVEVSWQVTGIRRDAYANTNRIHVEEDKPPEERGTYLHPELFVQGEQKTAWQLRGRAYIKQSTRKTRR